MKIALTGDTHEGYQGSPRPDWDWFWYEIAKEKPDLLAHTGDWGMTWEDVRWAMERMRKRIHCPVIGALGNHDFWTNPMEPDHHMLLRQLQSWLDLYQIQTGMVDLHGIRFGSFTGWYDEKFPPTNDRKFINPAMWDYLAQQAMLAKEKVFMEQPEVVVTHFPITTAEARLFSGFGYYLMIGHWHGEQYTGADWFDFKFCNAGSDYGKPKYLILNI